MQFEAYKRGYFTISVPFEGLVIDGATRSKHCISLILNYLRC